MARVFVTGCAGFLGSHLADYLFAAGHEVSGCDDLSTGDLHNLTGHRWLMCSIEDIKPEDLHGVDVLMHTAALPYEGVSSFSPSLISRNIYAGSAAVFSAAIEAGVRKIVNCSSMARYGIAGPPFKELSLPAPVDPYGIAKEAAERLLINLAETHGIDWTVAVPHNIFGPRQRIDPYRNVCTIFVNRMLRGEQPIIYGDGHQVRCFSYIDDVVPSLARMGFDHAANGQIINIGPDDGAVSILDLAKMLAEIIGIPFNPIFLPPRPREVKHAVCSSEKARRLLGFEQKTQLRDGLEKLVEWIRERGPKPFEYHLPIEIHGKTLPMTWAKRLM